MAHALSLSHILASLVCLAVTVLGLLLGPQETWNSRSDSNPTPHERGSPNISREDRRREIYHASRHCM